MALFSRLTPEAASLSSPGLLTPPELKVGERGSELGGEVKGELEEWPGSGVEGGRGERSPGRDSESLNL